LLAAKLGAICQLSYRNSDLSDEFTESEKKALEALKITEYKIWSYNLTQGKVDAKGFTTRGAASQALTGVISLANEDFIQPKPFVCFRGTKSFSDMLHDLASLFTTNFTTPKGTGVGNTGLGFAAKLSDFYQLGLEEHVIELVKKHQNGLFITGHSLGGAVASLFTAALHHDYPELFSQEDQEDQEGESSSPPSSPSVVMQVTFGAPRVYDRATALKINSLPFKHLRFVNATDYIPTLPHWKRDSLFHTGDCYYAEDQKYVWHMIPCGDCESEGVDTTDTTQELMTLEDRVFNFAPDAHVSQAKFNFTYKKFVRGEGDTHSLSEFSGYLDQIVNSYAFSQQLNNCTNAEVIETFNQLPVEIAKANGLREFEKAALDWGSSMNDMLTKMMT
jgi:hypothetical protein